MCQMIDLKGFISKDKQNKIEQTTKNNGSEENNPELRHEK